MEWNAPKPAVEPQFREGPITNPEKESVNLETHGWFFEECERNRALLQSVYVEVPVRPADGVNHQLSRMCSIWYGEGIGYTYCNDHMGGFIEITRANIAYDFVKHMPKALNYLLMIDNDMEPPINLPYLLARHQKPIVAAPAVSVDVEYGPQLCFSVEDESGDNYRFPCLKSGQKIPAKGLKKVGHAGTGAICIRRDVLEKFTWEGEDIPFMVPQEARLKGMETGRLTIGEDIAFCNQVRAKGFDIFVDLEAHCGHRKVVALQWDASFTDPLLKADEWRVPCFGKIIHSR